MAEIDPKKEGKRIAHNYLSSLGWARQFRWTITREISPGWTREEMEEKFRRADQMEEEAEADFSQEYERWRKDDSLAAKEVLKTIYQELKNRKDLGFFGKRILARLRHRYEGYV